MKKPVIGVVPLIDPEMESYWMLPGYMEGVMLAGGLPVMLPLTQDSETIRQIAEEFDGFLFTGGHDVYPGLYGETPAEFCGAYCIERDQMETKLLTVVLEGDKPILGICRGIQLLNAVLGGTLYQDIPMQAPSQIEHHQTPPYHIPVHEVAILEETPLFRLLNKTSLSVNSYHHQAIKELSPRLRSMAVSPDGLTEAVWMPEKNYVWAVQWHPEFSFQTDKDSQSIFSSFLYAAAGKGNLHGIGPKAFPEDSIVDTRMTCC